MMVMRMAMTPSLKASRRLLLMAARAWHADAPRVTSTRDGEPGIWYERGMKRAGLIAATVAALVGCKDHDQAAQKVAPAAAAAQPSAGTGKLGADTASFAYAVFFLPRPKTNPEAALAGAGRGPAPPFRRAAKPHPRTHA